MFVNDVKLVLHAHHIRHRIRPVNHYTKAERETTHFGTNNHRSARWECAASRPNRDAALSPA
jgi:hypothetical protein